MRAFQITEYGAADVLQLNDSVPDPEPAADEVLIRIAATSVNPVDAARRAGYGHPIFNARGGATMPLILGHDLSGVVSAIGSDVKNFEVGQKVWAAPDAFRDGTYAEMVAVKESEVDHKPANISHMQAATLPYVALTTWAALADKVDLSTRQSTDKPAFVHAGAGGVGSFAIQLLKVWGFHVTTTCGASSVALCERLGADQVIDYSRDRWQDTGPFELVFDTMGYRNADSCLPLVNRNRNAQYVSIVHELMPLTDARGLLLGGLSGACLLSGRKLRERINHGRGYHWSLFRPNGSALAEIRKLVESEKVQAVIDSEYEFEALPQAHTHIETGHVHGKLPVRVQTV
ncbi:MAG: NADPH:quinone reductase-like Zn-dependent oxidoreductase [Candidatus Azotimanducaceae bacterium]